jgi:hypothetical protein
MTFPSRLGAVVVVLSGLLAASVRAEIPSSAPSAAPAPAPAPAPTAPPDLSDGPAPAPPAPPIDPAKEAEIRKLLLTTGTVKVIDQMLGQLIDALRQRATDLPPQFWDNLRKEMDSSKLIEKMIPVYDKYYSLDDLKAVNAFYQTPAGQHLLQTQPQILKESMAIGQEWGRAAGMRAVREIEDYKRQQSASTNSAPQPTAPAPATP